MVDCNQRQQQHLSPDRKLDPYSNLMSQPPVSRTTSSRYYIGFDSKHIDVFDRNRRAPTIHFRIKHNFTCRANTNTMTRAMPCPTLNTHYESLFTDVKMLTKSNGRQMTLPIAGEGLVERCIPSHRPWHPSSREFAQCHLQRPTHVTNIFFARVATICNDVGVVTTWSCTGTSDTRCTRRRCYCASSTVVYLGTLEACLSGTHTQVEGRVIANIRSCQQTLSC